MNSIEVNGLEFFYYLSWHAQSDTSSLSLIPKEDSLQKIISHDIAADKVLYDVFVYLDEYCYEFRQQFDFRPLFKETQDMFEIEIVKKNISSAELSGVLHEVLKAA
ncbi:hypothetical protein PZB74_18140 [Porifericola rhodea]|uniref:hypothetical protein n=1 Tax=Porifericola rhodea TaxID=930972 RepID=UPI002665781C|nr:hypothetical protein [Porifericola rhodea]WKN30877.1 hypothetical protein PZB74_18140 [Porifericola rhodea]